MITTILLLDYGGVLGLDHLTDEEEKLARTVGLSQSEVNNRISEKSIIGRAFRENKISEIDFWRHVTENYSINSIFAHELTRLWMNTYCLNEELMSFLQSVRKDIQVGVLTNIDVGRSSLLETILDVNHNLDFYFPSYRYGHSKDSSELWVTINEVLKNRCGDCRIIYADDRAEHVLSAEQMGWTGIQYHSFPQFIKQIQLLIG